MTISFYRSSCWSWFYIAAEGLSRRQILINNPSLHQWCEPRTLALLSETLIALSCENRLVDFHGFLLRSSSGNSATKLHFQYPPRIPESGRRRRSDRLSCRAIADPAHQRH